MTDTLREKAMKAEPKEWSVCTAQDGNCSCKSILYADGVIAEVRDWNDDMADASGHAPSPEQALANKHFIAAANPSTILSLLDRIEKLEGALRYTRPLLVKYAYTQGNAADFVREITQPVDEALRSQTP